MPGKHKNKTKGAVAIENLPTPDEVGDSPVSDNTSTASTVVLQLSDQDVSAVVHVAAAVDEGQEAAVRPPSGAEGGGEDSTKDRAPKKRRRVIKPMLLSEEVERQLGDWLEFEVTYIYDKKDQRHMNKDLVNATWDTKAKSLTPPLTMEELKKLFDSIRTRFGKLSAGGKSGQGAPQVTDREKWILNTFLFLRPHIVRQGKTKSCGLDTVVTVVS